MSPEPARLYVFQEAAESYVDGKLTPRVDSDELDVVRSLFAEHEFGVSETSYDSTTVSNVFVMTDDNMDRVAAIESALRDYYPDREIERSRDHSDQAPSSEGLPFVIGIHVKPTEEEQAERADAQRDQREKRDAEWNDRDWGDWNADDEKKAERTGGETCCPECGSAASSKDDGERFCEECGYVFGENDTTDDTPAWQATIDTGDDPQNTDTPSRVDNWSDGIGKRRAKRTEEHDAAVEQRRDNPELTPIWEITNREIVDTTSEMAVLGDTKILVGVDPNTGDRQWETQLEPLLDRHGIDRVGGPWNAWSGTIEDGRLVVWTDEGIGVFSSTTGLQQWSHEPPFEFNKRWTAADDELYLTSDDGQVQAVSLSDQSVLWTSTDGIDEPEWQTWGPAAPLVTDDLVIVAANSDDGRVTAYDRSTGDQQWRFFMRETPTTLASAAGFVLAGTVRGDLYALDPSSGRQQWRHRLPEFGTYEDPGEQVRPTESIRDVQAAGDQLLVTGGGFYATVLDATTGRVNLEVPAAGVDDRFTDPEGLFRSGPLVLSEDLVLWISGSVLQAYDFHSEADAIGETYRWHYEAEGSLSVDPCLLSDGDRLAVTDTHESLCVLSTADGIPQQYRSFNSRVKALARSRGVLMVQVGTDVYAFESEVADDI